MTTIYGTVVVNLCGTSSTGKSTAEMLMCSPFMNPEIGKKKGLCFSANSTQNAMFALIDGIFGVPFVIDDINNNCTEYPENNWIKCPHCDASHYFEKYSVTTCENCPPIYQNGVHLNPHNNTVTTYCYCLNCNKEFSYKNKV